MKIRLKRKSRKGAIDRILVEIILIIFAIVSIPAFQALSNSNAQATKNISTNIVNVTK